MTALNESRPTVDQTMVKRYVGCAKRRRDA